MAEFYATSGTVEIKYAEPESRKQKAKKLRKEAKAKLKEARELDRQEARVKADRKIERKRARARSRRIEASRARLERIVEHGSDADAIAAARELLGS